MFNPLAGESPPLQRGEHVKYSLHDLANDAFGFKRTTEEKQQQLIEALAQPSLPAVASDPALQSELRAATQGLVCLSQEIAQLMAQVAQLTAEAAALKSKAAYRSEQISFSLGKAEFISPSGQICCFPTVVAEKIADILQLRSGMAGWNWIVAHPEIIGNPSDWKAHTFPQLVPEWTKDAVNKLLKLPTQRRRLTAALTATPTNLRINLKSCHPPNARLPLSLSRFISPKMKSKPS